MAEITYIDIVVERETISSTRPPGVLIKTIIKTKQGLYKINATVTFDTYKHLHIEYEMDSYE